MLPIIQVHEVLCASKFLVDQKDVTQGIGDIIKVAIKDAAPRWKGKKRRSIFCGCS